ncbi:MULTISPECIES: outer membrane beta-barrel protein [unclassified Anaeromyxobacter]|uniref:outer membrane beta-barrel protein n=1 Tax=unclassified Anaeromyxobacter TaxID=2620896 RepID=UPI001F586F04|nr:MULTISPECIES: outer membrane beta-barrel protein [unclassified Anaeromyxobacter]
MRKHALLAAIAALLLPAAASAQVSLGARLGFAPAMGNVGGDAGGSSVDLSDFTKSQIPLQLDLMVRVTPQLALGGYASYGWSKGTLDLDGTNQNVCDLDGVDCSGGVLRLGVQATYAFSTTGQFQPWAGVGTGWERNRVKAEGGGEELEFTFSGWEVLNLQLGGDYFASPRFAVGPYLMLSIGRYGEMKYSDSLGNSASADITDKDAHEWVQFGVRGRFDL